MENSKTLRQAVVYKVVVRIKDGLYSAFVGRAEHNKHGQFKIARKYAIDQKTLPIRGTKLFAFLTLEDAKAYKIICEINDWQGDEFEIYEATANSVRKNGWHSSYLGSSSLRKLPTVLKANTEASIRYPSCVVCGSITLRKKVS